MHCRCIASPYASIAGDLVSAGYSPAEEAAIKQEVDRAVKLRDVIRHASGEVIDLKAYEADMRHLIDTYVEAETPKTISNFGNIGLLDLILKGGLPAAVGSLPKGIQDSPQAVAETIANNVRSKITREHRIPPARAACTPKI